MAKYTEPETNAHNKISLGTNLKGNIESSGDIRLDGSLVGNLNTKGKLVIGQSGKITGEVICKNADIEGKLEGKINVEELLTLKSTSELKGDIITKKLAIEAGAKFSGTCDMSSEGKSISEIGERKEK